MGRGLNLQNLSIFLSFCMIFVVVKKLVVVVVEVRVGFYSCSYFSFVLHLLCFYMLLLLGRVVTVLLVVFFFH